jgi:hypothetical protein
MHRQVQMTRQLLVSMRALAGLIVLAFLVAATVGAQAPAISPDTAARAKPWTPPRTPDGQPDLQGVWGNATITPFERPSSLANKEFFTEAEAAQIEALTAETRRESEEAGLGNVVGAVIPNGQPTARATAPRGVGTYNEFWTEAGSKLVPTRRTSLVVDPPDGIVQIRPEALERKNDYTARSTDSYEFMSVWDRCITRGIPGSMFPTVYNNFYQIHQAPGYVVIVYEMIHDARVIPLDGRPHAGAPIRLWMGDSRGRWEGDTLVVETSNFNSKGMVALAAAAGRINRLPHSESFHVIERFTRVGPDTISYQATIEDPNTFVKPWTVDIPLIRQADARIFEYACHEGNRMPEVALRGARAEEQAAEEAARAKAK